MKGIYIDGRFTGQQDAADKLEQLYCRLDGQCDVASRYIEKTVDELRDESKKPEFVYEALHHVRELSQTVRGMLGLLDEFSSQAEAEDTGAPS